MSDIVGHTAFITQHPHADWWTPTGLVWLEINLRDSGANTLALYIDGGGGYLSYSAVGGRPVDTDNDRLVPIPAGAWYGADLDPHDGAPKRVWVATQAADSRVYVHASRREVCRCAR